MNSLHSVITLHGRKLLLITLIANIQLLLALAMGQIKWMAEIDWLDIFGEGGATLLALSWTLMVLYSRPQGRVTNLLFYGLTCFFIASWQDMLDEIIRLPDPSVWAALLESLPMPLGIALLGTGLFQWHQELKAINRQLEKRERIFRDHRFIDQVTQLGNVVYLKKQIDEELKKHHDSYQPFSLLMVDIDQFDGINRRYGYLEGDRLLRELSELLLLNLRRCDLLCHYAGDRFAVLLPATGEHMAELIAQQLLQACRHFAFKTLPGETIAHTVSIGVVTASEESTESLLNRANRALLQAKDQPGEGLYRAA